MGAIESSVISTAVLSGWKYVGRGMSESNDGATEKLHLPFPECVAFCERVRVTKGEDWNGIEWFPSQQLCQCNKDDRGHNSAKPYSSWMHFRV